MKKRIIVFVLIFLQVGFISACENGQIDINSAEASELVKLTGIGEIKAQEIIKARPFESVEDLINVWGIGEKTLERINEQGLACVENSEEKDEDLDESEKKDETQEEVIKNIEEVIILNDNAEEQNIKTPTKLELKPKANNFAMYGFASFFVLLGVL